MWQIEYYNVELEEALLNLPEGIQARYIHLTQRMLTAGPNLGMPHTRALGNGLFELRMMAKEGIGRVFFCLLPKHRIVMLHEFLKKSQDIPLKELYIAKLRMQEVKKC